MVVYPGVGQAYPEEEIVIDFSGVIEFECVISEGLKYVYIIGIKKQGISTIITSAKIQNLK